ncbi:MAG: hypothetical protein ACI4XE_11165 [Acutalibacteraceae bacterium]
MEEKKGSKALNFVVGTVVIILVIAGIVSIIGSVAGKIRSSDKSQNFEEYESFISPFIMNDPNTFDDVSKANQEQLIAISVWSILQNNPEPDKYEYSDGDMLIPQTEVEQSFKRLFGNETKIVHTTVDGGGIEFQYSEKKKCYVIPITGIAPIYTPKVIRADEKSGSVILTVGYLASEDWVMDENGNMTQPEPSKYMKVTLRSNSDGTYYISALQSTDQSEIVTEKK